MKTHYLVAEKMLEKITKMKTSIFFWVGLWLVGKRVEGIKGKGKKKWLRMFVGGGKVKDVGSVIKYGNLLNWLQRQCRKNDNF
jgi:hypothetical protein